MDLNEKDDAEETPVKLVPKGTITPQLGTVRVGEKVLRGEGNNTRWVFDVAMNAGDSVRVEFINFQTGRNVDPEVLDFPQPANMSESAASTKIWTTQDGGAVVIHSAEDDRGNVGFTIRFTANMVW